MFSRFPTWFGRLPGIDKIQSRLMTDIGGAQQRLDGRIPAIIHLVVFVERRHVPWDIRRDTGDEFRHTAQLMTGIVETQGSRA